jgi:hypothetical protein
LIGSHSPPSGRPFGPSEWNGLLFLDVSMPNGPLNLDSSERKLDFRVDDNEWNGLLFLDVSMPNGPLNLDSSERKL